MKLFRIHTNYSSNGVTKEILDAAFNAYTVMRGFGVWKGEIQECLTVEIYTDDQELVTAVAEKIKERNNQEAVLVTETSVALALI